MKAAGTKPPAKRAPSRSAESSRSGQGTRGQKPAARPAVAKTPARPAAQAKPIASPRKSEPREAKAASAKVPAPKPAAKPAAKPVAKTAPAPPIKAPAKPAAAKSAPARAAPAKPAQPPAPKAETAKPDAVKPPAAEPKAPPSSKPAAERADHPAPSPKAPASRTAEVSVTQGAVPPRGAPAREAAEPRPALRTPGLAESQAAAPEAPPSPPVAQGPMRPPPPPKPAGNPGKDFRAEDHVVYPTHGVGQVQGIEEIPIAGMTLKVIVITFEENRMTLKVPIAKAASSGLRKLASDKVMGEAMDTLRGRARIKRTMWSRRAQEYEQKINSGDPIAIAEVVRDLHRNAGQPDQSFSERQIYELALERLSAEVAALDRTDKPAAQQKLIDHLNKAPA